jgi:cytochrome c2
MTSHEHLLRGCFAVCLAGVLALLGVAAAIVLIVERSAARHTPPTAFLGDPERGRTLVVAYGCPSCHAIGGAAVEGMVGPPLNDIGARSYIAGRFPNIPGEMQLWLEHPQQRKPGTAMPDLGVGTRDAGDIAAYLGTLR